MSHGTPQHNTTQHATTLFTKAKNMQTLLSERRGELKFLLHQLGFILAAINDQEDFENVKQAIEEALPPTCGMNKMLATQLRMLANAAYEHGEPFTIGEEIEL